MRWWRLLPVLPCLCGTPAMADQFHYNNVLVGTRAVGLGGAFGAIADDASGLYYNPAGLAFAQSNDVQGSANAFYNKTTVYQHTLGNQDFTESSSGSLTPFFGGLQKLDKYVDGLVFAFGVYYVDGDLKDQDTTLTGDQIGSTDVERYHRTSNARDGSYYAGAALAYRVKPNFGLGFGLSYYNADELVQEFQYARQSITLNTTTGTEPGFRVLDSNIRQHLSVYGLQPSLGAQLALGNFSFGLTVKKTLVAAQSFDSTGETSLTVLTGAQNSSIPNIGQGSVSAPVSYTQQVSPIESKKPVGTLPWELRLGSAWFASPTFLVALDVTYYSAVTDADVGADPAGLRATYNRNSVTNLQLGTEWYMMPSLPLRFGLFTNNDARPQVAKGSPGVGVSCSGTDSASLAYAKSYCGQPDHIDYVGGSLFIAWVQPTSQISAGVTYQDGSGKAEKLGDDTIQNVTSSQYSFAFSATHNL